MTPAGLLAGCAVLVDLDGTLVDSEAPMRRVWGTFASRHKLDEEAVLRFGQGRSSRETIRLLVPDADHDTEAAALEAAEIDDTDGVLAPPGAAELLDSGRRLAVVTSCSTALARVRLRAAGLPIPGVLCAPLCTRRVTRAARCEDSPVDSFPDLRTMTEQELNSLIKALADQEAAIASGRGRSSEESEQTVADVSYQRRILRGQLDIARAELVTRLRGEDDDGGPGSAGVRQPRPPGPHRNAGAMQLPVPRPDGLNLPKPSPLL